MANSQAERVKAQREAKPMEQRQVEALEQIADALVHIQSHLAQIAHAAGRQVR